MQTKMKFLFFFIIFIAIVIADKNESIASIDESDHYIGFADYFNRLFTGSLFFCNQQHCMRTHNYENWWKKSYQPLKN